MVGWIKITLGTRVGLGPGHIVLDRDTASLPHRSTAPNFRRISVAANDCMDQGATWYIRGRPRPKGLCVRWDSAPRQKRGEAPSKKNRPTFIGQTAGWIKMALGMQVSLSPGDFELDGDPAPAFLPQKGGGLSPWDFVLDGDPPSPQKGGGAPNFRPISIVAKRLDASRCHLVL